MRSQLTVKSLLQQSGFKIKEYHAYKKVKGHEITIEFCIGDYCVGVFDKRLDLLQPKFRAKTMIEAIARANLFEDEIKSNRFAKK